MKKALAFFGKHIWWVIIVASFLVWKFDRPLWDQVWNDVTGFVTSFFESSKDAREKIKEMKKDLKP